MLSYLIFDKFNLFSIFHEPLCVVWKLARKQGETCAVLGALIINQFGDLVWKKDFLWSWTYPEGKNTVNITFAIPKAGTVSLTVCCNGNVMITSLRSQFCLGTVKTLGVKIFCSFYFLMQLVASVRFISLFIANFWAKFICI